MKLLLISPNYPFPKDKGDRIRINGLLRILQALDYEIDLICLDARGKVLSQELHISNQEIYQIKKLPVWIRMIKNLFLGKSFTSAHYYSHGFLSSLKQKLDSNNYEIIFVCSSAFDYLLPILKNYQTKVIWDLIDFDSLKWAKFALTSSRIKLWLYQREARLIKQAEKDIIKFASYVSVISQREIDRANLNKEEIEKVFILPQLIEACAFHSEKVDPPQIIFSGQMDYLPNIEAVKFFDQEVMPLVKQQHPDIIFKVAGRNPSAELIASAKHTFFTGEIEDMASVNSKSRIAVVPLKSVFGVPIKVLDAMSLGLPVIATTDVAKTIEAKDGVELLIANSAMEFVSQIDLLLRDQELGLRIAQNAKSFIENKFSLRVISTLLKSKLE